MYIYANPNYIFKKQINEIIKLAYEYFGDSFIDQLNPKAELGCHDYHITMIGNIQKYFTHDDVFNFVRYWKNDLSDINIRILNKIKITKYGKLLLLVKSDELYNICNEMKNSIDKYFPNNNMNYYLNSDQTFHITLGIITDKKYYNNTIDIHEDLHSKFLSSYNLNDFSSRN
jgi:hypothetical protein